MVSRLLQPKTLGIVIAAIALVVIVGALAVRGGDEQGKDSYPDGARVTAVVRAVDSKGVVLRRQPESFTVTLTQVGARRATSYGTSAGPGKITFFGQPGGTYVLRPVSPKGEPQKFDVAAGAQVTRRVNVCLGNDC